jgi:hypothetical protein
MNTKVLTLIVIAGLGVVSTFMLLEPIPQDPGYHHFADNRIVFGIPNGLDVLSNVPLIIIGVWGIVFTARMLTKNGFKSPVLLYFIFFIGIFFTGFGSSYYHHAPSNDTLFWDRLPMTIAFMGFFCSVICEMASPRASRIFILPLLAVGVSSVLYWHWSEALGRGDLRLYGLVQFLPIILITLILFMYKLPVNYLNYIIAAMFFYFISKMTELLDIQIFQLLGVMSGHTLKHVFAAGGTCCILIMLHKRRNHKVYE